MRKIKYGMIGGGIGAFIGDAHRRASRLCNRFELIGGVFDVDYEKNIEFARIEGISTDRVSRDIEGFIKQEASLPIEDRIEAVAIVTPNFLHYSQAKMLLKSGFHVMCEKPITLSLEEAIELERIVKETGLSFALAHTYTGYPMIREMRSLIEQGGLGDIQRIDAQYYQGWINPIIHGSNGEIDNVWRLDPKYSGISSCMADIGVHAFNMVEYVSGLEVDSVLADLSKVKVGVKMDLDGTVLLRFNHNAKGVIRASQVATGEENRLEIAVYGSKASLKWSQENPNILMLLSDVKAIKILKPGHQYNTDFASMSHTMPAGHPEGIYESLANIYNGFAKSIMKEPFLCGEFPTVHDGVRGMKFVFGTVASSSKNSEWVTLST